MMLSSRIYIWLIILLTVVSCKKDDVLKLGVYNQLEHEGATLPVYVHGNTESNVAIIVVHGGPGESAILKRDAIGFYRLEQDYQVVYYDQRASGITEGNVDESTITIDQMAKDLDAVVELVEQTTEVEKIFLVSLDWGSSIAVTYLTSSNYDEKVMGYIATNPGFNGFKNLNTSLDTLQVIANQFEAVEAGSGDALQNYINQTPIINQFNYEAHYRVLDGLLGIEFFQDYVKAPVVLPGYSKRQVENNLLFVQQNLTFGENPFFESMDVENLLIDIPIPTKFIWGTHNLLFPSQQAVEYQSMLGSISDEEQVSYFRFSANRPYYEEGDRFYAVISTWITFF